MYVQRKLYNFFEAIVIDTWVGYVEVRPLVDKMTGQDMQEVMVTGVCNTLYTTV